MVGCPHFSISFLEITELIPLFMSSSLSFNWDLHSIHSSIYILNLSLSLTFPLCAKTFSSIFHTLMTLFLESLPLSFPEINPPTLGVIRLDPISCRKLHIMQCRVAVSVSVSENEKAHSPDTHLKYLLLASFQPNFMNEICECRA